MADMGCQELVELVTAYLDDVLDVDTRARFEEHLGACDGCTTYVDQFRETIHLLGALETANLSDESLTTMREAFREWAN